MRYKAVIKFNPEVFRIYDPKVDTHVDFNVWDDENDYDGRVNDPSLIPLEPIQVILDEDKDMAFKDNPHIKFRWLDSFKENGDYDYEDGPMVLNNYAGITFFDVILLTPVEEWRSNGETIGG